jgi:hypothetical protein
VDEHVNERTRRVGLWFVLAACNVAGCSVVACNGGSKTLITPPAPDKTVAEALPAASGKPVPLSPSVRGLGDAGAHSPVSGLAAASQASVGGSGKATAATRLVAIGDVHGDLQATRAALRLAGAIDDADRWIGGKLTLVQTGDQLDRGDDERPIVDLFERLVKEAAASGGRFVVLNGNHEVMNVQGDFRYVTPGAVNSFDGVTPRSPLATAVSPTFEGRAAAFFPGGAYALKFAARDVIAVIHDSVFVHGGVLPEHVTYGIDRINQETRTWMRSGGREAPASVASERAPIWVRDYSVDPVSPASCEMLGKVLESLRVKRMVVGHTVQQAGISTACGERVYRIDVGLGRYYGNNPIQVLEIDGERVRVLVAPR